MDLGNYVQVHDRLLMALEKYPELRIQELEANFAEFVPEGLVLICRVSVWRTPDDPVPTIASACAMPAGSALVLTSVSMIRDGLPPMLIRGVSACQPLL